MTNDLANAIAASAWNVCGPRAGTPAAPATVRALNRTDVLNCLARYQAEHDGSLFTPAQIEAARDLFAN